jgi:hypothetical protein
MFLEVDLPKGKLTIDVERRIGWFCWQTPPTPVCVGDGKTPWQIEWENGNTRFDLTFHAKDGRTESPRLRAKTNPVVFLLSPFVGELGDAEFAYDSRRRKLTISTENGRFPYYVENGTLEWSKARKLFLKLLDPRLEDQVQVSWLSGRGYERRWHGTVVIGDERILLGSDRRRHDLNLSLNVYLTKETPADCLASIDPMVRALALLDRRLDRDVPDVADSTCCPTCFHLWQACVSARQRLG